MFNKSMQKKIEERIRQNPDFKDVLEIDEEDLEGIFVIPQEGSTFDPDTESLVWSCTVEVEGKKYEIYLG